MTTTLTLIETSKIDTRRDGAISWIRVRVLLDGIETGADFRARVGEEPIVVEGDTITVPDAQVETLRQVRARTSVEIAERAAREASEVEALIAKLDTALTARNASPSAAEELRAFYRANGAIATDLMSSPARSRFDAERKAIMTRHGLLG